MKRPLRIAGGGLAGLSLGVALARRGVAVELHEALTYPRHRVCGEFISGVKRETLDRLGIRHLLDEGMPLSTASWNDGRGVVATQRVEGIGISRWRLDDTLRREFESAGGVLVTGSRLQPQPGTVWAAGRPRTPGPWIGLKAHFRSMPTTHDLEMFLSPVGYAGLARVDPETVNLCGLFRSDAVRGAKGPELLMRVLESGGLHSLVARLRDAEFVDGSFCGVAGFLPGVQAGPEFSIGDAAFMIPPFTGNGMSMAFESAECALDPCLDHARGDCDWHAAAARCAMSQLRRFRKRMRMARVLHGWITRPSALRFTLLLARRHCIPFQSLLPLVR
ncbi:MAG: hypothetical protein FJ385_00845 [Verrucomicrobia bacterium]|nr:hypothetical protein [Verrucomicrobiota bacterium]